MQVQVQQPQQQVSAAGCILADFGLTNGCRLPQKPPSHERQAEQQQ